MQRFWNERAEVLSADLDWAGQRFIRNVASTTDLPRARVLELGCGLGSVAAELHRRGASVTGVDFSLGMISRARQLHGEPHGLNFVESEISSLDLEFQFDLICGIAFLHEIDQSQYSSLIASIDRLLAPGGCAYFLENSYFNPIFRVFREQCVGRYGIPRYGGPEERPFDEPRWHLIQEHFKYSARTGDIFYLLGRVDGYILKSRWPAASRLCTWVDQRVSDMPYLGRFKALFSYYQTLYFSHTRPAPDLSRRSHKLST